KQGLAAGDRWFQDSFGSTATFRKRYERTVRERLSAFRRDGDCPLLHGHVRANCFWFERQRAVERGRCFLEGTAKINSRASGNTVESDSRAQCGNAARSWGNCSPC